ncbi:MAG: glycoside hydrolase family 2 TIM barrel-domain containing protein, partial [Bacteroidaceae bacterium]|nr:glycoside hydrolase family 2 TIM barrel-domain containing protein [Bacteroidaceae bacterium]
MPDETIREALDRDMSLLREMGVNCIRQHSSVPAKWIQYIYEKYGIWTMIYSSFGRYGLTVDGVWHANTDYEDPKVARTLLEDAMGMIKEYNGTPGLLMYMLGNENNYGLFWKGAEAENLPMEDRSSTKQAHALYKIMNDAAIAMKKANATAPIAICNGDLLFIDIIAKECTDVDLLGVNVYRGPSFGDLFDR